MPGMAPLTWFCYTYLPFLTPRKENLPGLRPPHSSLDDGPVDSPLGQIPRPPARAPEDPLFGASETTTLTLLPRPEEVRLPGYGSTEEKEAKPATSPQAEPRTSTLQTCAVYGVNGCYDPPIRCSAMGLGSSLSTGYLTSMHEPRFGR